MIQCFSFKKITRFLFFVVISPMSSAWQLNHYTRHSYWTAFTCKMITVNKDLPENKSSLCIRDYSTHKGTGPCKSIIRKRHCNRISLLFCWYRRPNSIELVSTCFELNALVLCTTVGCVCSALKSITFN